MLNKEKHLLIMGEIIRSIYMDTLLSSLLGFKGGTCAFFFYGLPRFSVDLDFDLLIDEDTEKMDAILNKIKNILSEHGEIKDLAIKRFTIFGLLSYGKDEHSIKVEISIRSVLENRRKYYAIEKYSGISILTAKKDYAFATKLVALTQRKELAMRDVYDIYFFSKNKWDIDREVIETLTGKKTADYLLDCIKVVENLPENKILYGLGELIDEKQKAWVRKNLKNEVLFQLKNYQTALKK